MWVFRLLYNAYQHFDEDDGWAISSHIALATLTSMFPFLIFLASLAGFLGSKALADRATDLLLDALPNAVSNPLTTEVHNVLTNAHGGLLTLSAVLAIYFSSSGVDALRIALSRAYGAKSTRSWWVLRLEAIGYVVLSAFVMMLISLSLALGSAVWELIERFLPVLVPYKPYVTFTRFLITPLVVMVFLLVCHMFLPGGRRSMKDMLPGITFTFVMWIVAAVIFGYYLSEFASNYISTYAGLASAMIALVFLYLLGAIFIFGAELNAALSKARVEPLGLGSSGAPQ